MRKKFYLPIREADRVGWLDVFNKELPNYAVLLGITPAELTRLDKMTKYYASLVSQLVSLKVTLKAAVDHKDFFCDEPMTSSLDNFPSLNVSLAPKPTEAGLWSFVSSLVNRIKASPNYAEYIGKGLGIIGHEPEFDRNNYKPKITSVKLMPGHLVRLRYKKGVTDGAMFYCRTNGGAWEKRAYDAQPPYDDRTSLAAPGIPERREYRCFAVMNDEEIGLESDVVVVIVG